MTKLTKLGARRLLKLAKILDTADALHKKRGERGYDQTVYQHECGTPACAWGHYVSSDKRIPKRLGFQLDKHGIYAGDYPQDEFSIDYAEKDELFGQSGCNRAATAKQAAKYIRSFVKRKGVA
jgi:hypothetical protein